MKLFTAFFVFLMGFGIISAQEKKQITRIGSVSEVNHSPIPSANILDLTSKKGTISDTDGIFRLTLQRKSTTLRISFTGFTTIENKITDVTLKNLDGATLFIVIVLVPKIEELETVEISSERFQLAYESPEIRIIDFHFRPEGLLLLLVENKDYKLRLVNDDSETLYDIIIPKKPQNLFKDCFGNLHIQYLDSVFQVFLKTADLD